MTATRQAESTEVSGRHVRGGPWAAVTVLLMALAFLPARPGMPAANLDASWGAFLHEAARRHWQFGPDIVFTYGPLGYLAVPTFAPDVFWWAEAFRAGIGACCGWAFHVICRRARWSSARTLIVLALLLPPTLASFDIPWLLPAVLWPFVGRDVSRVSRGTATLLALVVAAVALVKFTTFLLAVAIAGLFLIEDVRRRRIPVAALTFAAALAALWLLAGQAPGNFVAWLHGSWETAAGYNEAMSTYVGPYQRRELLVFATTSGALLLVHAWQARWRRITNRDAWASFAVVGLLLFVLFKLGFVRQDAHVTAAMFAMPLLAALGLAPALASSAPRRLHLAALVVTLLAFATYAYGLRRHFDRLGVPEHYRACYAFQFDAVQDVLRPLTTHRRLAEARSRALETLRAAAPLPDLQGPVDIYGHRQGAVLAHELAYAPRPVFQGYGTYTPALAGRNRAYLEESTGPRHVLFTSETIDFRYPLTDDGASLPTLLARFDVKGAFGDLVHLERRTPARDVHLIPLQAFEASMGDEFAIPTGEAVTWAAIECRPTLFGRLVALAYKLPPIAVDVRTADGMMVEHRLIRAIAADGMLVSPLVTSTGDLLALLRGQPARSGARVTALRVRPAWPAAYAARITIRVWSLTVSQTS